MSHPRKAEFAGFNRLGCSALWRPGVLAVAAILSNVLNAGCATAASFSCRPAPWRRAVSGIIAAATGSTTLLASRGRISPFPAVLRVLLLPPFSAIEGAQVFRSAAWKHADWAPIDNGKGGPPSTMGSPRRHISTTTAMHTASPIPTAALAVSGDRLYLFFRIGAPLLLENRKGPNGSPGRSIGLMIDAVPGGERLLLSRDGLKTVAFLGRRPPAQLSGAGGHPAPAVQQIVRYNHIENVSRDVVGVTDGAGSYAFSVPLSLLALHPWPGQRLRGDISLVCAVREGGAYRTIQRVYWHNRMTGSIQSLSGEEELEPQFWGILEFVGPTPPGKKTPMKQGIRGTVVNRGRGGFASRPDRGPEIEHPLGGVVVIARSAGGTTEVARATTDIRGSFEMKLPPGDYSISVAPDRNLGPGAHAAPVRVTVRDDSFSSIRIELSIPIP